MFIIREIGTILIQNIICFVVPNNFSFNLTVNFRTYCFFVIFSIHEFWWKRSILLILQIFSIFDDENSDFYWNSKILEMQRICFWWSLTGFYQYSLFYLQFLLYNIMQHVLFAK